MYAYIASRPSWRTRRFPNHYSRPSRHGGLPTPGSHENRKCQPGSVFTHPGVPFRRSPSSSRRPVPSRRLRRNTPETGSRHDGFPTPRNHENGVLRRPLAFSDSAGCRLLCSPLRARRGAGGEAGRRARNGLRTCLSDPFSEQMWPGVRPGPRAPGRLPALPLTTSPPHTGSAQTHSPAASPASGSHRRVPRPPPRPSRCSRCR